MELKNKKKRASRREDAPAIPDSDGDDAHRSPRRHPTRPVRWQSCPDPKIPDGVQTVHVNESGRRHHPNPYAPLRVVPVPDRRTGSRMVDGAVVRLAPQCRKLQVTACPSIYIGDGERPQLREMQPYDPEWECGRVLAHEDERTILSLHPPFCI